MIDNVEENKHEIKRCLQFQELLNDETHEFNSDEWNKALKLRVDILSSEADELLDANNMTDIRDALIDMSVMAIGIIAISNHSEGILSLSKNNEISFIDKLVEYIQDMSSTSFDSYPSFISPEMKVRVIERYMAEIMDTEYETEPDVPALIKCEALSVIASALEIYKDNFNAMNITFTGDFKCVNDSNYSKFFNGNLIDKVVTDFDERGIVVDVVRLKDRSDLYGAFSRCDQKVNGKFYNKGKLVKPYTFIDVNFPD